MGRGPLFQENYKASFSGHETFPLRYGWLKKVYDAVTADPNYVDNKQIFLGEDAIARFGVGKNMVISMRHWAACCGIIEEDQKSGQLKATNLGEVLFGHKGLDPYLENNASLWLLHWLLCSHSEKRPSKTTWFWVFSHFNGHDFKRDDLVSGLLKLSEECGWRASNMTVQRDVECFARMYETQAAITSKVNVEESLESPFAELGLLRGIKGYFQMIYGPKPSLPIGIFALALDDFWGEKNPVQTMSFEAIAHDPGAPGKVFLLDETDLANRLLELEAATNGVYRWSETAGLKQVLRERPLMAKERSLLISKCYSPSKQKEAA